MSDLVDRANDAVANHESDGIARARRALEHRAIEPCGACHWCNEPLRQANQLFCDSVCAADHAGNQRRNAQ